VPEPGAAGLMLLGLLALSAGAPWRGSHQLARARALSGLHALPLSAHTHTPE
jgi:hypothetical protein